jgi:pimeloyl-ACP methyl ester carboxylesterase
MTVHRKKTLRRWSIRILLFIIFLPVITLIIVRSAGWFNMRKTDREMMAHIGPHVTEGKLDTFRYDNRRIVFLRTSKDEKKKDAIIFVHGSPGSMDAFLEYVSDTALLAKADLVTYDRPGFGNSDFGHSLASLLLQAEVLERLMDTLAYDRYWLVGHSYGAPIIVQAAMRYPGRIAGLSIVAGSVSPDLEPKAIWRKWIDIPLVRELLPVSFRVSNEELMPLKNDLYMIEDDWDKIRIPVSLAHGTSDVLVPFENMAFAKKHLVNAPKVLEKVFEKQSHFILWTHKQEIVKEIIELMK